MADTNMNDMLPALPPPSHGSSFSSNSPQKKPSFKNQQIHQNKDIKRVQLNEVRKKVQERIELFNKMIVSLRRYIEIKKEMLNLLKDLEKDSIEKEQKIKELERIHNEFTEEMAKIMEHVKNPKELHDKEVEIYSRNIEKEREIENLFKRNDDNFVERSKSIMKSYNEFTSTTDKEILNYILNPEEFKKVIEENQRILNVLRLQMQNNASNVDYVLNQQQNENKN